jgi:hypothetical protein
VVEEGLLARPPQTGDSATALSAPWSDGSQKRLDDMATCGSPAQQGTGYREICRPIASRRFLAYKPDQHGPWVSAPRTGAGLVPPGDGLTLAGRHRRDRARGTRHRTGGTRETRARCDRNGVVLAMPESDEP